MSGSNYKLCDVCEHKAYYNGELEIPKHIKIKVLCDSCSLNYEILIVKIKE